MKDVRRTLPTLAVLLLGALLSCSTRAWELAVVKARANWLVILALKSIYQNGFTRGRHSG